MGEPAGGNKSWNCDLYDREYVAALQVWAVCGTPTLPPCPFPFFLSPYLRPETDRPGLVRYANLVAFATVAALAVNEQSALLAPVEDYPWIDMAGGSVHGSCGKGRCLPCSRAHLPNTS